MVCAFVGWCALSAIEQAAWLQAIGSLIGIGVAIAVPWWMQHLANERAKAVSNRRAMALGLAVRGELQQMGDRLNKVWDDEHPDHHVQHYQKEGNAVILGEHAAAALDLPEELSARVDELHEMGAAGDAALRAIHHIHRAREWVTIVGEGISAVEVAYDAAKFYDELWAATVQTGNALSRIDAQFPTPPRPKRAQH